MGNPDILYSTFHIHAMKKSSLTGLEFLLILAIISITVGIAVPYFRTQAAERAQVHGR